MIELRTMHGGGVLGPNQPEGADMPVKSISLAMVAGAALLGITPIVSNAQQSQPTIEQALAQTWKAEHNKILNMAKDFPEHLWESRPHPDARTFLDELRHVTIGLEMSSAQLRGDSFDYNARVAQDQTSPATRQPVVAAMEAAIAESYPLVEAGNSPALPRLAFWMAHQGEHYGKLVTIYRMNGLVPPVSR